MILNKKIIVVLPAYNAEKTLESVYNEIPHDLVDELILVDDCSDDNTVRKAKELGIQHIIRHNQNMGYGGNQKTCYNKAAELNADIVIMLHPDYQYTPRLIPSMAYLIANGSYPIVFASRILGGKAIKGGMPIYKYFFNRLLTVIQNLIMGAKLSEYHTGFRAFDMQVLKSINYMRLSDNFIFDNEIVAQIFLKQYIIAEITCPTRYNADASNIGFIDSVFYGFGVLRVCVEYRLYKLGFNRNRI